MPFTHWECQKNDQCLESNSWKLRYKTSVIMLKMFSLIAKEMRRKAQLVLWGKADACLKRVRRSLKT
ncbi:hypothetical protein [Vibrio nigripulchritudo]|uniref:hypothetical protein n=1 Tax=Vibrio nigripulchritudo TaxID=28173 RepID=UPI0039C24193